MASDYLLEIDGIKGESQDKKHKDTIEVQSFSWGASQPGSFASGSGGGAGKASFQDLHFTSTVNKASPLLAKACATGQHIKKAVLFVRKAGGAQEDFDRVRPMLDAMGQNIHLVGPTGAGATIKLVNQMMNIINALGAMEGLILATKAGIDPELAHEILRTSSGASRSLDAVAQTAFSRNFEPGFAAELMHKDVSLAVSLGRALGVRLLSGSLAEQLMQEALSAGYANKTFTASMLVQEQLAGLTVTKSSSGVS